MMFVNQGIRQLRLYPERSATCQRHFLLFVETYPAALRTAIRTLVEDLGADYRELDSVEALLAFIQRHGAEAGTIKQLDVFAHGVIGRIEFGYATAKADAYRFTADHARRLSPKAFAYDGRIYSYACRTGLGNPVEMQVYGPEDDPKYEYSLAQTLADAAEVEVFAFPKRTSYALTYGTGVELARTKSLNQKLKALMNDTTPSGRANLENEWLNALTPEDRKLIDHERSRVEFEEKIHFPLDQQGALHPVSSAETPIGLPAGIRRFTPKKWRE